MPEDNVDSGYMEYDRESYGGPLAAQRAGAREWSSPERWRVPEPHPGDLHFASRPADSDAPLAAHPPSRLSRTRS